MSEDHDERKRPHLRLVVDNVEKRARSGEGPEEVIPFEELAARKETFRVEFYSGLGELHSQYYQGLERFISGKGWPYALDPTHGRMVVLQAPVVAPEIGDLGASIQDEILLFIADDRIGTGLCISLEMIMPFYSEDDAVMEDSLLFAPPLPYGTLFLEENRNDRFLDLIYRLAFPLLAAVPEDPLYERLFAAAAGELRELTRHFSEYPEEQ